MNYRNLLFLASLCLCGTLPSIAEASPSTGLSMSSQQENSGVVKGIVTDASGEPIIGAAVKVKDSNIGTNTDVDGAFSIKVKGTVTLEVSYLGYLNKSVVAVPGKPVTIVMEEDNNLLDEIVVVGYGTARRGDLTGPISSVKGDVLTNRSTQMLSSAMQGQIAGVEVTRSDGGPGSGATVRVRGVTTMSTNDPLVIIDGVPGSLNDVVATDIESMSVLKDAASASIYGSRAAAGVILITTKRAGQDKFTIDYNFEYSFDKPTTRPKVVGAIQWMELQNEIMYNDGAADPYSVYSKEFLDNYASNHITDPYTYPDTYWEDVFLKSTTHHQQHSLNVAGGTEKLRSKFTFNYQQGDGYYVNKSYERYAGRLNNDYKIASWMRANIDVDFSTSKSVAPATVNVIDQAYAIPPIYRSFWPDGTVSDIRGGSSALGDLLQGGTSDTNYYKFGGKAQLDLTPIKGLTITALFAPRYTFTKGKKFQKKATVYDAYGNALTVGAHSTTHLTETRNENQSRTYQFYANYQNKWGDNSVSLMAGYEFYKYKWENLSASRQNYTLESYPYLNLGPEDYQYNSGSAGHNAYESVFGRVMYSFKERYLLQANIRADGSSRFSSKCRWGTFPSVSAGWIPTNESWFPKTNILDYMKIRGAIGSLGNERIGSEFPYQAAISFGNSYMYDKSSQSVVAVQNAAQVYYAFEDITWETTTTYDIGIDLSMFDSRFSVNADWYYKKTSNMLLTLGFPSYAGFSAPSQNAGDMNTKGFDLELGWHDRIGEVTYSVSANLSDYRSKMGYLGDKRTISGNYITEEGSYYNEWYMYMTDGLFVTEADLYDADGNKYPTLTKNDKEGNIKYVDVNGDGVINADDKVHLGNSLPELQYGGSILLGWNGFDFNLAVQGVGHRNVLYSSDYWLRPEAAQSIPTTMLGNYWSQNNTEEQNRNAFFPRITLSNTNNTVTGSDYWLFNGAYFRVKNITLGYTLPEKLTQKFFVNGLRVYASINDLPAISNYPKGWDPESGSRKDFISTSYTLGVHVKF